MAYNQEIINQVLKLLAQEKSVIEISATLDISKSTIYNWRKKYQIQLLSLKEVINNSRLIKNLIATNNFSEALRLSEDPKFQDYFPIQSQRISILMRLKRNEEALKLSEESRFQDYFYIQSQRISILMRLKRNEEALGLSEESRFQSDFYIQSQRISILMKLKRDEEALSLSEDSIFQDYFPIQSQRISILTELRRYEEALKLSEESRFQSDFYIQSQRISILMRLKRDEEALSLSEESRFQDYFPIQSQRISILMELRRYEEALKLSEDPRFQDFFPIQFQRISILRELKRNEEALRLSEDPRFQSYIQSQRKKNQSTSLYKNIITKIKNHSIASEEDILNLDIFEWQKVVLIIAFYEINNYPIQVVMNYLKRQNAIYQNNPDVLKLLKKLLAHIKAKRKIFDIDFYLSLLKMQILILPGEREYLETLSENMISIKEENPTVGSR